MNILIMRARQKHTWNTETIFIPDTSAVRNYLFRNAGTRGNIHVISAVNKFTRELAQGLNDQLIPRSSAMRLPALQFADDKTWLSALRVPLQNNGLMPQQYFYSKLSHIARFCPSFQHNWFKDTQAPDNTVNEIRKYLATKGHTTQKISPLTDTEYFLHYFRAFNPEFSHVSNQALLKTSDHGEHFIIQYPNHPVVTKAWMNHQAFPQSPSLLQQLQ